MLAPELGGQGDTPLLLPPWNSRRSTQFACIFMLHYFMRTNMDSSLSREINKLKDGSE